MGQTIALRCKKCGEEILLNIGQGIRDNDLTRVLRNFDEKKRESIKQAVSKMEEDARWEFHRMPAVCKNSNRITTVPTFHIINGEDKIIAESCDCKGDHLLLSEKVSENREEYCLCPKCNNYMSCRLIGLWD